MRRNRGWEGKRELEDEDPTADDPLAVFLALLKAGFVIADVHRSTLPMRIVS